MLRKSGFFAVGFILLVPILASAQAPKNIRRIIRVAKSRYVAVENNAVRVMPNGKRQPTSTVDSDGTGFRIGGDYIITNFHLLRVGEVCMVDGKPAKIVRVGPEYDLLLLKAAFPKEVPWIRLVDAEVGETVYSWSNAGGKGDFFTRYIVSKADAKFLYFQEPSIPGISGSGFVNQRGELVGLAMQDGISGNGDGLVVAYTEAIPALVLRQFLKGVLPGTGKKPVMAGKQ